METTPPWFRSAGGPHERRLARIDRLLDLVDAARMTQDANAREQLWIALGGHEITQGHEATREALARILDETLAVADARGLDDKQQQFAADVIQLITTDLQSPTSSEDLSIRTLAYRSLAEGGSSRVADNARWRLYDHVRATLAAVPKAPAKRRQAIALHVLYVEREDLNAVLSDRAIHARPPTPSPHSLVDQLHVQRNALASVPRWQGIVAKLVTEDEALAARVLTALPGPRSNRWPLMSFPRGTGSEDPRAPVVIADTDSVVVDATRPQQRLIPETDIESALPAAADGVMASEGTGQLLLVAPPQLPAPQLAKVLTALSASQVAEIDLAIHEPALEEGRQVLATLPMQVVRDSDLSAGARALTDARIQLVVDGRKPTLVADGRRLSPLTYDDLAAAVAQVAAAYPRERGVALMVGSDLQYQQLLQVVALLRAHFGTVGWRVTSPAPADHGQPQAVGTTTGRPWTRHDLEQRAQLWQPRARAELEQPFPFREADQRRLQRVANELYTCVPELERAPTSRILRIQLSFEDGRLARIRLGPKTKVSDHRRRQAVLSCAQDVAFGFRLREHRDTVTVVAKLALTDGRE